MLPALTILEGDALAMLRTLPDESVHCVVTSPPYWGLRDYGVAGQIGLEETPEAYVAKMVEVFREVKRVLRDDGTCWCNLGDAYANPGNNRNGEGETRNLSTEKFHGGTAHLEQRRTVGTFPGLKPKDLCGIPWRVAFALQADGWYLRSDIIWHKPNPMPESVTDRPTKAHEYLFLLSKESRYFYDSQSIMEPAQYGQEHANKATSWGTNRKHPNKSNVADYAFIGDNHTTSKMLDGSYGRNRRSVWTIPSEPNSGVVSYGRCRIASPSCPVHDYQADRARALEYGERLIAFESGRNPDTGTRPFEVQEGAFVAIPLGPCASLFDGTFAICRNNENHKTAVASGLSEIFYGIPDGRIECIAPVRRSAARFFRKHASKNGEDAFGDAPGSCPSEQTGSRIVGILTFDSLSPLCTCQYIGKVEKRQDHFACFPTALVKPCILAGTSAKGCCPKCGKPWERVTETSGGTWKDRKANGQPMRYGIENVATLSKTRVGESTTQTLGWRPGCECRWFRIKPGIPQPTLDMILSSIKLGAWRTGFVTNAASDSNETKAEADQ